MYARVCVMLAVFGLAAVVPAAVSAAPYSKLTWRNIGPWIGGRVVAVAGVPSQENLFYMGAVDGGIWKSTDYGLVWTNLSDGTLPSSSNSIGAIAVAPSNANVLYAGTGESDIRGDIVTGDGVYKSTDAGKTWRYAGLRDTRTTTGLIVDPHDSNVVYASSMGHVFKPNTDRGVFKSTDGGKTWRKILFIDASTGAVNIVMDTRHPNVLYAAMWQAYRTPWTLQSGGAGSGLYKTIDGGAHWTNISHNTGFPSGILGKIGVCVAQSNPQIVYAIVQAKEGGVFRSNDGGAHWFQVNDEWKLRQRAFYYMAIFADPTNPETVYAPQVDGVYVSHDGGKNFTRLRPPHGDNHIVWVNPNNPKVLLEGNDGGATVSTDGGKTWSTEHNQPTGQFYHINIDGQFPFHVYGAQQDEGSFEGPSASPSGSISLAEWNRVAYGESTFVVPQPGNTDVTYGSGYFSIFMRYDKSLGEYRSVSAWPYYQEGAAANELEYRFAWTHPILFTPANRSELLIGSQYVLKSADEGQTWNRISPDLTRNDPKTEAPTGGPIDLDQTSAEVYPYVSALAVSPLDTTLIWAGSSDGLVHVTTDGGAHWNAITPPGLPERTEITSIEPSHFAKGTAYLSASGYMLDDYRPHVFATSDYGRHWTSITTGIPSDSYVFTVRQDPNLPQLLFATTKNSVYTSRDEGVHWTSLALNLPRVQVRDLQIDTRQGALAIATHGRAFWVLENLALVEQWAQSAPGSAADGPRVYTPQSAWLTYAFGGNDTPPPGSSANPPFGATVFFDVPASYDGKTPVRLSFLDAQGNTVRSFALHRRAKEKKLTDIERERQLPSEKKRDADEKLTAISAGTNRFQWDLRYGEATEARGYYVPIAAGGLEDGVDGPEVVPGTYTAVLDYGGQRTSAKFDVQLDPRIHTTPQALADRLALEQRIHTTLDALDKTVNGALDARDRLHNAVAHGHVTVAQAQPVMTAFTSELKELVQFDSHSSEGPLLHESKLRDHLAYLAAEVGLAYAKPTAAQYAVFERLEAQAKTGEEKLRAAEAAAKPLL